MKPLLFLLCALCVLGVNASAAEADILRLASVLPQKEVSSHYTGQPGPCGELSPWQLTRTVWRQHMGQRPFAEARNPALARECAVKHLEWLRAQLLRRNIEPTAERLATCWHYGISHAERSSRWGQEVSNLYYDHGR